MENQEKKYVGYGYHGGGRKYIGRKSRTIKASDEEWNQIKGLAEKAGKDISRYVVESVLKENPL